jgi:hypothetical protein
MRSHAAAWAIAALIGLMACGGGGISNPSSVPLPQPVSATKGHITVTVSPNPIMATWYVGGDRKFEWTVTVKEDGEVGGVWTRCGESLELASGDSGGFYDGPSLHLAIPKDGTQSYTTYVSVTGSYGKVVGVTVRVTFVDDLKRIIYLEVTAPAQDLI